MPKTIRIIPEIREAIVESGGTDIYKCYQCGKCTGVCPWFMVDKVSFLPHLYSQDVKLGTITSSEDKDEIAAEVEDIFRCVGCDSCTTQCPHSVDIPDIIKAIRSILVEYGTIPSELKSASSKIVNVGNPLGEPREKRANWAEDLQIKTYESNMEYLYFSCCIPAYDIRAQEVARATAKILKKANVSFGILGEQESCCCEAIGLIGAEKVFNNYKNSNINLFKEAGVKKIITTSPHCYHTFKNEYPEFNKNFEVIHQTEIFASLIEKKKLKPLKNLDKKVVYHDPCKLGRQNGIYDEPRIILQNIPGLELLEMDNFSHKYSVCCGGGSGGLWLDRPVEERMTNVRLTQAFQTGADILAVACPYCLKMFQDGIKVMNLDLEVKDISELLSDSL